jgi:hypothetical protein
MNAGRRAGRREMRGSKERLSLFEKAAILRIAPEVLNDIEHGRRTFEEVKNTSK